MPKRGKRKHSVKWARATLARAGIQFNTGSTVKTRQQRSKSGKRIIVPNRTDTASITAIAVANTAATATVTAIASTAATAIITINGVPE